MLLLQRSSLTAMYQTDPQPAGLVDTPPLLMKILSQLIWVSTNRTFYAALLSLLLSLLNRTFPPSASSISPR